MLSNCQLVLTYMWEGEDESGNIVFYIIMADLDSYDKQS